LLPPHEAAALDVPATEDDEWRARVDFAVVIGGDGTFLRAARYVFGHPVPLYGINVGRLGFLAIGDPGSAERDIEQILSGNFSVQDRHLVRGTVLRSNRPVHELHALNDLVITKGAFARAIDIELRVGEESLCILPADGMIVSTPTGSTAYALSAGGPIVPPHVPCMILAPICAHTLYARPIILGEGDVGYLIPRGENRDLILTQDGQLGYEILPGDRIEVRLDPEKRLRTISLPHRSYYDLLREKLQWGSAAAEMER
jgi:NAD+ kinase